MRINIAKSSAGIAPHGGVLVDRLVPLQQKKTFLKKASTYTRIQIDESTYYDLEMIAIGAFSPLIGFLGEEDYRSVVSTMRLRKGTLWPLPITLSVGAATMSRLKIGQWVSLAYAGAIVAIIKVESVYETNRESDAVKLFGTKDKFHPGVSAFISKNPYNVGGKIQLIRRPAFKKLTKYNLTPEDTRLRFRERGWKTVVGFQTRNPLHRAHEYITKAALQTSDGLLIHPLVGKTKEGDLPAEARMRSCETLIQRYYEPDRVVLSFCPANMSYAGPREAVLHAIIRQNYGCTHFIVGRDHAGFGRYYDPYAAQECLKRLSEKELSIRPICFESAFWSKKSGSIETEKTSRVSSSDRIRLSGSQVRDLLKRGQIPPAEVMRPEVSKILMEALKK